MTRRTGETDRRTTRQKYDGTPWICRVPTPAEKMLAKLRIAAEVLGHSPSKKELAALAKHEDVPGPTALRKRFGSWNRAKALAGLEITEPWERRGGRTAKPTLAQRFRVLSRDGFRCTYCGRGPADSVRLMIDHVLPLARGGRTVDENLRTACFDCNAGKGAMVIEMEQMVR